MDVTRRGFLAALGLGALGTAHLRGSVDAARDEIPELSASRVSYIPGDYDTLEEWDRDAHGRFTQRHPRPMTFYCQFMEKGRVTS